MPRLYPPGTFATVSFAPRGGDAGLFGWYLSAGDSPSYTLFADPKESIRKIFSRRGKPPAERAISLDCRIYINPGVNGGIEKAIIKRGLTRYARKDDSVVDVTITFDGENFIITRDQRSGSAGIIFRGKAVL